ncbi:hypothetical protein Hanom_Chr05g00445871 [Helianthus anomalus]
MNCGFLIIFTNLEQPSTTVQQPPSSQPPETMAATPPSTTVQQQPTGLAKQRIENKIGEYYCLRKQRQGENWIGEC